MAADRDYQWLVVVVRYDGYATGDPSLRVTLKETLPTSEEADLEAERLNRPVESNPDVSYFVQELRLYPSGRHVEVG